MSNIFYIAQSIENVEFAEDSNSFIEKVWDEFGDGEATEHQAYYQIRPEYIEKARAFVEYCRPHYKGMLTRASTLVPDDTESSGF